MRNAAATRKTNTASLDENEAIQTIETIQTGDPFERYQAAEKSEWRRDGKT
jgi:hypothetical protein